MGGLEIKDLESGIWLSEEAHARHAWDLSTIRTPPKSRKEKSYPCWKGSKVSQRAGREEAEKTEETAPPSRGPPATTILQKMSDKGPEGHPPTLQVLRGAVQILPRGIQIYPFLAPTELNWTFTILSAPPTYRLLSILLSCPHSEESETPTALFCILNRENHLLPSKYSKQTLSQKPAVPPLSQGLIRWEPVSVLPSTFWPLISLLRSGMKVVSVTSDSA